MMKCIQRTFSTACTLFLFCGLLTWNGTAYSAIAPVVSTLSAITEGSITPVRIAADQYGNFYVTDPRGGGVLKYNSAGNVMLKINTTSKKVLGIAIAKSGDILVSQEAVVAVYSAAGGYKSSFGAFGTANGIAIAADGTVFVADSKNNKVQAFSGADYSPTGVSFGTFGIGDGQFKQPTGITFEKLSNQVAVVDTLNGRIQFFTTGGVYQKTVGSFGSGPLKFTSPQAVAFEYSADGTALSRMYVVDSFQANVQVIDAASSGFLRYVGNYGFRSGQLVTPGDILLDSFNRLVIPNGTGSLVLFGIEGLPSGSSSGNTAVQFPPTSNGTNPPTLTLNPVNAVTNNNQIAISGTVTVGSTVSVNGTTAAVYPNGTWALTVSLPQQGMNNLTIVASNGSATSSISSYITLDAIAPVVAISSLPLSGSTTSSPIQTISGSVSDISATTATVTVNGVPQTIPVNNGLFNSAIVLGSGSNSITVSATDAAGNTSTSSPNLITYNPLAPVVTVATPGAAVSGSANYTVTGSAPAGSAVAVNGLPATLNGTFWTVDIPLQAGLNPITITATAAGAPSTTISSSVVYAPGQPSLAVVSPVVDIATAKPASTIVGKADAGNSVTASLNGTTIPVTVAADGSFTVTLPPFTSLGTYTVALSTIDPNGKISSTSRSLVYDPTPPAITVVNATQTSIQVSSTNGVVIAKDKNGAVPTPTNGTSALDLSGITYDSVSLNIQVITATGLSSRNGDINGDGKVDIADALLAARISLGTAPAATTEERFGQLLRGDVGPLRNHLPVPDGKIRLDDAILILQKSIGIDW